MSNTQATIAIFLIVLFNFVIANAVTVEPTPDTNDFQIKVATLAFIYGVDVEVMGTILDCENPDHIADLQSEMKYSRDRPEWGVKKGDQELSYGVAQIHLPSSHVTYEQAIDVDFSLRYLAKEIKNGHSYWWSCYNIHYKK